MVRFKATISQFTNNAEKTGWSYIKVPAAIALQLKPDNKKTFRVKGKLDEHEISGVSLLPMGDGDFILAVNGGMRKGTGKNKGASLQVELELDTKKPKPPAAFMECLKDEPTALDFFKSLTPGHQNYFSKWILSAKTEGTKTKRIGQCVNALSKRQDFGQMLRSIKKDNEDFRR